MGLAIFTGSRHSYGVRVFSWLLHMALPLLGLWLLIARPEIDGEWEHHQAHFWLVLAVAVVNVALGAMMSEDARRRGDARLFLVAMAFLSSAVFFALHALATPRVLVSGPNAGFVLSTPVGLLIAAVFAAVSTVKWRDPKIVTGRMQAGLRAGLAILVVALAVLALARPTPLAPEVTKQLQRGFAVAGCALYVLAAARYFVVFRRRPSVVLLSVITAFVLLAEAMVAVAISRAWHASWWEWHVLMVLAFGFVAYSAWVQAEREGSRAGLFDGIALDDTVANLRREYGQALEALVEAVRRQSETGVEEPVDALAVRVGERFELTERQTDVLSRSAEALAGEREQAERLGALVAVGQQTTVIRAEEELLARALELAAPTFPRDTLRLGLIRDGALRYLDPACDGIPTALVERALTTLQPAECPQALALPLQVKGHPAGVLTVQRPDGQRFAERERSLLASLANQLSVAVENARLYRQLDGLFRSYMSPAVATSLIADPEQAALGGATAEITVLYADLQAFTPFAERTPPVEVVALLNRYYGLVVPIMLEHGGTVAQFVGDEVVVLFNAPVRQPDHALRACRGGLAMQRAVETLVAEHPGWPRFRVGINTGPAVVGNIGSAEFRNYTAIGDTMNLGARIQAAGEAGQVLLGPGTYAQVRDRVDARPLGTVHAKGKTAPVAVYLLLDA
jgi:class 3 adenylate cyclase